MGIQKEFDCGYKQAINTNGQQNASSYMKRYFLHWLSEKSQIKQQ